MCFILRKIMKYIKLLVSMFMLISINVYAEKIPFTDIISLPDTDDVVLSPDGKHIAFTSKVDTETHQGILVVLFNTETNKSKNLIFSNNEKYTISNIFWGSDDVLLIKARFPSSKRGTLVTETRLLKLDINTKKLSGVLSKSFLKRLHYISNVLTDVIDLLPEDEDHILMGINYLGQFNGKGIVKVAITEEGSTSIYQHPREFVSRWLTDSKHNARIAVSLEEAVYTVFEKLPNGEMRTLWQFEAFSKQQVWPRGFGADHNILYVKALHNDKNAIFTVDLTDPKLTKKLVFNHKRRDVSGRLRRNKETNEFVGIGYHYWQEDYKAFVKALDTALPNTKNLLLDKSKDGNKYILFASNDNEPGVYYIGDRKNSRIEFLAAKYNKLTPDVLSEKEKISYKARDGLKIHGYLTYPKGAKKESLPVIIFPHGGPISFDGSGFDYWTQFFANKGYAVLQMNFRGSSGYGHDFMQQGLAAWGQAMQDDVEDGARWLIKEGIANKDKMCIAGASYGGYAALMGAVKTPELYQCVISFAGVTDVQAIVLNSQKYMNHEVVEKQVGDQYFKLRDNSPILHADKIKAPVLLIHGTEDRIVRVDHSEEMYDELESEDKNVQFVPIENADHYLSNNKHRLQTFRAMDKFLDKYLPVKSE